MRHAAEIRNRDVNDSVRCSKGHLISELAVGPIQQQESPVWDKPGLVVQGPGTLLLCMKSNKKKASTTKKKISETDN